jgi:hypothetical protein
MNTPKRRPMCVKSPLYEKKIILMQMLKEDK